MTLTMLVPVALTLLAAVLGAAAWSRGQLQLHLLLVFPVVTATGGLGALAVLSWVAAVAGWMWLLARPRGGTPGPPKPEGEPSSRRSGWGGVILLGPIPIAVGNRPWAVALAALMALLVLAAILLGTVLSR